MVRPMQRFQQAVISGAGACNSGWLKIKTATRRAANRDRGELFEKAASAPSPAAFVCPSAAVPGRFYFHTANT